MLVLKLGIVAMALVATSCMNMSGSNPSQEAAAAKETPTGKKSLVLGGGCFWCVEAVFEALKGVDSVESGYAGGHTVNPTYRDVCSGETGHAEVVKVTYDPKVVSESDLLHIFFTTHDPTTMNRQGPDSGTQYRSVIFYADDAEKALAQSVIEEVTKEKIWSNPIVTTLEPLTAFYKAEDYHQDYFEKYEKASPAERMSMNAGYCSAIIDPKVRKFRAKYADKLKK